MTWHAGSAVLAYDAQIAAAGITTVFDSFRVGVDEFDAGEQLGDEAALLAEAIRRAADADLLRADHLTHLRCEVAAPNVVDSLHAVLASHSAQLISLMDHSPGQRQYRDLEKYFIYYSGKSGRSRADLAEVAGERQRIGGIRALENRPRIVEIAKTRGIVLASHDDTTAEEVALARCDGVTIAEFPTTLEAASASRAAGMATVMGAPNVVRGGSHSGNASARELAEAGQLDILSSDYVPAALLMAAFRLADAPAMGGLAGAMRLVSKAPAEATGLKDRGEIAVGRRADLLRVANARRRAGRARGLAGGTPRRVSGKVSSPDRGASNACFDTSCRPICIHRWSCARRRPGLAWCSVDHAFGRKQSLTNGQPPLASDRRQACRQPFRRCGLA